MTDRRGRDTRPLPDLASPTSLKGPTMTTTTKRYTGPLAPGAYIASGTEPWLQDAATGEPVDLLPFEPTEPRSLTADDCECRAWAILPGVFAPCNTPYGIEAHDECREFAGDIEAAEALAAHLSTVTGKMYEIWFEEIRP